jgi:hypothetical protein
MAGAVELQSKQRLGFRPGGERCGAQGFVTQRHRPAATLAEGGSERIALAAWRDVVRTEHRACGLHRLQLEVAAAYRADHALRRDEHSRAGCARRRPARREHLDDDRALPGCECLAGGLTRGSIHRATPPAPR